MSPRKARERVQDANRTRERVRGIIAALFRHQLTHEQYLVHCSELYATDEWQRLTLWHSQEFRGMLRGAVEAAYATSLVWCHFVDGRYQTREELPPDFSYATLDSDTSRHCWRDTRKVF